MRKMWTPSCLLKRDDSETDSLFVVCVCVCVSATGCQLFNAKTNWFFSNNNRLLPKTKNIKY